jgi:hypothetical protein
MDAFALLTVLAVTATPHGDPRVVYESPAQLEEEYVYDGTTWGLICAPCGNMPQNCYAPRFGCYPCNTRGSHRYPAFHGTHYRRPYNYRNYFDYPWHAALHEPTSLFAYNVEEAVPADKLPPRGTPIPSRVESHADANLRRDATTAWQQQLTGDPTSQGMDKEYVEYLITEVSKGILEAERQTQAPADPNAKPEAQDSRVKPVSAEVKQSASRVGGAGVYPLGSASTPEVASDGSTPPTPSGEGFTVLSRSKSLAEKSYDQWRAKKSSVRP